MPVIIDAERGKRAADLLFRSFSTTGIHGRTEMTEDVAPRGVVKGSLEHTLFITLSVAIDYQRDSDALWESSRLTFNDPETRYLFIPQALHENPPKKIIQDMQRYKLSKKPNKDAHIWRTVGVTFFKKWEGDPRNYLANSQWNAPLILARLKEDSHLYAGKRVHDYPYLRGDKIGPLWVRMLRDNVGLSEIRNLHKVPIPVNVHIARSTLSIGVVRGSYRGSLDNLFEFIRQAWFQSTEGLRVRDRDLIALDLDEPLWHLSKYGCTDRDKMSGVCPHITRCEAKEFCIPGRVEVGSSQAVVDTDEGGKKLTLCVVPCGSRKIWDVDPDAGPTMTRDVYIGPFSRKCQEYARKFYPNRWCILSAKYGFLGPREIVPAPYNVSFNDPSSGPITASTLTQQAMERGLGVFDEVVVLGGKNYVAMIEQVFTDKLVKAPLRGAKGIGYMMGMMNEAIAAGAPIISAPKGEDVIEITKKPKREVDSVSRRVNGGTLADRIRRYVFQSRIDPAREEGVLEVRIKAGDIHREMGLKNRMPAVCGVLDAKKFLHYARVKLVERSGPKFGSTATWVFNCGRVIRC